MEHYIFTRSYKCFFFTQSQNEGCDTLLSFFSSSLKTDLRSPLSSELWVTSTHLGAISSRKDSLPVGSRLTLRCFCKRSWWDHRKGETDPVPGHEKSRPDLHGKTKKDVLFLKQKSNNENPIIIYSPSCHSKPVCCYFVSGKFEESSQTFFFVKLQNKII